MRRLRVEIAESIRGKTYDLYIYGVLAVLFAQHFFPPGSPTFASGRERIAACLHAVFVELFAGILVRVDVGLVVVIVRSEVRRKAAAEVARRAGRRGPQNGADGNEVDGGFPIGVRCCYGAC
jgi:hypothetical protein